MFSFRLVYMFPTILCGASRHKKKIYNNPDLLIYSNINVTLMDRSVKERDSRNE